MNAQNRYKITMLVGIIILLTGVLLAVFTSMTEKILESGIITIGMVMIVIGFLRHLRRHQEPVKDELTKKIANKSAAYSWVITLLVLLVVYWLNYFEIVNFSVDGIIGITYTVMILTMVIFQQIFWRRGDVE